jgi:hypothetical protein
MKTKSTKAEIATHQAKGKVKINKLELRKETIQNLSDQEANAVKGGVKTVACTPTLSPS